MDRNNNTSPDNNNRPDENSNQIRLKWYTQSEYIDQDTGEVLKTLPKDYYITKTIKLPTHYGKTHAIKKIRHLTKRNGQTRIW